MSIILCDIDGTLADISHRLHFINGAHKDYDAFFDAMVDDKPLSNVVEVVRSLWHRHDIIFLSGRPDSHREQTNQWLSDHVIPLEHIALLMRKAGDFRPDYVVKRELYETVQRLSPDDRIVGVIDDRPQVIEKCWRPLGVTVFKVGEWDQEDSQRLPRRREPTLTLLVGPSRAGKSTWVETSGHSRLTVSSDHTRGEMLSDWRDQSHNDAVFKYIRDLVALRIRNGIDTIVDATNIRDADRKAFLNVVDKDCNIVYLVFNRPLEDKLANRGLIPEAVVRKHEVVFQSNLKNIMAGDNDPRVTVVLQPTR